MTDSDVLACPNCSKRNRWGVSLYGPVAYKIFYSLDDVRKPHRGDVPPPPRTTDVSLTDNQTSGPITSMSYYVLNDNKGYGVSFNNHCENPNPVCTHNTSDEQRAELFLLYDTIMPDTVRYMPLRDDKRGPIIRGRCKLDSDEARSYLVTADEAARRIRDDGVRGFYIYAGKESHGTDGLIFTDEDEPEHWPDLPESLQVMTGSGTGYQRTWINDGWTNGAEGKDDLEGIGGVRVNNTGVVVPGSIHHETCGIYHTVNTHQPVPLSPVDVPEGLRPGSSGSSGSSGKHTYDPPEDIDESAVGIVNAAIRDFRCNSETSSRAIDYFTDLRDGKNYKKYGFTSDDGTADRNEANLSFVSKLYGILLMAGETDKDRNHWLMTEYIGHISQQYPRTDDGQPRKWTLSGSYTDDTISKVIDSFGHEGFMKWSRKTKENNFTGEYSSITKQQVIDVVEVITKSHDHYPTKSEVVDDCHVLDDSRAKRTYDSALQDLVGKSVKRAHLGGNEYRYYPLEMDDPDEARSVKPGPMGW